LQQLLELVLVELVQIFLVEDGKVGLTVILRHNLLLWLLNCLTGLLGLLAATALRLADGGTTTLRHLSRGRHLRRLLLLHDVLAVSRGLGSTWPHNLLVDFLGLELWLLLLNLLLLLLL